MPLLALIAASWSLCYAHISYNDRHWLWAIQSQTVTAGIFCKSSIRLFKDFGKDYFLFLPPPTTKYTFFTLVITRANSLIIFNQQIAIKPKEDATCFAEDNIKTS